MSSRKEYANAPHMGSPIPQPPSSPLHLPALSTLPPPPPRPHLVCAVKEGQQLPLLRQRQELPPLLRAGVDAGGVVRAGVQQQHGPGRRRRQVGAHAREVQATRLGVKVAVLSHLKGRGARSAAGRRQGRQGVLGACRARCGTAQVWVSVAVFCRTAASRRLPRPLLGDVCSCKLRSRATTLRTQPGQSRTHATHLPSQPHPPYLHAGPAEDGLVVAPGGVGQVHDTRLAGRQVLSQELGTHTQRARAWQGCECVCVLKSTRKTLRVGQCMRCRCVC